MDSKKIINIFIVDDNKTFALALEASIASAFENIPINVHAFDTGEKCMESFMQMLPELVILDYVLNSKSPDAADGLQVLDKIKINNFETSVIMLTSNDHIDTALKSFHHGASDYVVKTEEQFKKINNSLRRILLEKKLALEKEQNRKMTIVRIIADKELCFQKEEKKKRAEEKIIFNMTLLYQNEEKEKRSAELLDANTRKKEVEKSSLILEEKNKDITDSIHYAKRIQQAKLPRKEEIFASLPNSFVLFKPKDIVSGDFYFFHKTKQPVFIVAADCTGHGVPGAFMSMIGSEKLAEAVSRSTDTSEILNHLNKGIKNSLHQSEEINSTRDGMDVAICSIDTENGTIKYAGANRPLWFIRKGRAKVEEIKGTKKGIGGLTADDQQFDSHEIKLEEGDTFYITTDGYADQFGGRDGKKLMSKKFKEILVKIQDKSMPEQERYLDDYLENWKAGEEQVDDILVIGVRL